MNAPSSSSTCSAHDCLQTSPTSLIVTCFNPASSEIGRLIEIVPALNCPEEIALLASFVDVIFSTSSSILLFDVPSSWEKEGLETIPFNFWWHSYLSVFLHVVFRHIFLIHLIHSLLLSCNSCFCNCSSCFSPFCIISSFSFSPCCWNELLVSMTASASPLLVSAPFLQLSPLLGWVTLCVLFFLNSEVSSAFLNLLKRLWEISWPMDLQCEQNWGRFSYTTDAKIEEPVLSTRTDYCNISARSISNNTQAYWP